MNVTADNLQRLEPDFSAMQNLQSRGLNGAFGCTIDLEKKIMTIQLELRPEIAARVETARAQGIDINAVLEKCLPTISNTAELLREQAKQQTPRPTSEQLKSALEAIAQAGKGHQYLPAEAFDRENLYEERI